MSAAGALLFRERCWTHPAREAAVRCPSCERSFCRECVTEHGGRLVCAECLRKESLAAAQGRGRPARAARRVAAAGGRVGALTLGLLAAWLFFHLLAQTLITVPNEFHQSTLWQQLGVPDSGGE